MALDQINDLLSQQLELSNSIAQAYDDFIKREYLEHTKQIIDVHLLSLAEKWRKFSLNNDAVLAAISKLKGDDSQLIRSHSYFTEHLFAMTHTCYLATIEQIKATLNKDQRNLTDSSSIPSLSKEAPAASGTQHQYARLPRINIPTFDGNPAEWLNYRDLFASLVLSNPSLTAVEKLQYLKTSLRGTASHLLKNTTLSADNFNRAWNSLVLFFDNPRIQVNTALQALINIKPLTKENASELEHLYTHITQIYRTLETLQRPVHTWDDFLVFLIVSKLDSESVKAWENKLGSSKIPPSWKELDEFLITRLFSLQAYEKSRNSRVALKPQKPGVKAHYQGKSNIDSASIQYPCPICKGKHYAMKCPKYVDETTAQRLILINKHKLCYNCLGKHRVSNCKVIKRCQKCGQKHHTTIHKTDDSSTNKEGKSGHKQQSDSVKSDTEKANVLHSIETPKSTGSHVMLATAQVLVVSDKEEVRKIRTLLDQGSEISLISERIVQQLRLPRFNSSISLSGIGQQKSNETRGYTIFKLKPRFNSKFELTVTAHILKRLTTSIPSVEIARQSWSHLKGIQLADPDCYSPGSIDLILGADTYGTLIEDGLRKGSVGTPIAQATKLGWVISGPTSLDAPSEQRNSYSISVDERLHELVHRFWEMEEVPSSSTPILSQDEQACEDHFLSTHSRDATGRYVAKLPFKKSPETLGNSKFKAERMIRSLASRFERDPIYEKAYREFMFEYVQLDHMRKVLDTQSEPSLAYYLPHHGVLREHSLTTKLRVVFNGSCPTSNGVSLNDLLHTGAKLQTDLFDVLLWFRFFPYVFTADIEKMFRQIKVNPDDWNYQRILWLNALCQLSIFVLTTVTYGMVCAPFLAIRTLLQLTLDEGKRFPLAIPIMRKGRYVDEFHGGADSLEEAKDKVTQLDQLCMAGGFILKKWTSNHPSILENIPFDRKINSLQIDTDKIVSVLGLSWDPILDTFQFTLEIPKRGPITKRTVLSSVATFYDPFGAFSPIIVVGKLFIQDLWSIKIGWDESLPDNLAKKWLSFVDQLKDMPKFEIPRWIGLKSDSLIEIYGFSDASQKAMAAIVYLRSVSINGEVRIRFIASKTKVAPLKKLTIPRLELNAAVLLVRLVDHLLEVMELEKVPVFLGVDSAVALTWIKGHPSRWKDFVQNRVLFVQKTLPQATWRFIPGSENPADLATRGLTPNQLSELKEWWTGPPWLSLHTVDWPEASCTISSDENLEERPCLAATTLALEPPTLWDLIFRYSSLTKLIRITALCRRVLDRLRKRPKSSLTYPLTVSELNDAKMFWIKVIQQAYFHHEVKILLSGQNLPSSSRLLKQTPRIDQHGLLRVGGRLDKSSLSESAKHPYILPKESPFTSLIIADAHKRTLHGGVQDTLSYIREHYWIIGGRIPVRSFILKCVRCARFRQQRAQQIMGQLPIERLTPARPFLNSGIDYAGPFVIKTWKGRNAKTYKAYMVLFVCMTTSAIHLELVTDYTTDAFLAAYKRFTARRGICSTLSSDCGTNLKGADAQLRHLFTASTKEFQELASLLANDGTQWKFIPPGAPHFGGKWEAGVKSVKVHLKKVIGEQLLTFEEMTTLLAQVEAVLNSRPLCSQSDDPMDISALTPGHFIIGQPLTTIPEPSLEGIKVSHLSRWQLLRQMLETF